ncbi:glycosyltransferase family 4 protein [Seonamhaeicola algicola]|uniref:Glycosyltransferase family 4 protein n=1 Tax=Seonamhaeicola algicola TaxID=1719036 RepID=A0A5C7AZ66_9FLAO|nr:glycosyltransferase family 1 protein [Seonamhaeicola algicola]TXE13003.1 glycosyltransferase family 4 protein [Seonamhaeicola algicola]
MIVINARFLTQPITGVQRFAIEISKIVKKQLEGEVVFVTCPGVIHYELFKELDAKIIGINKSHLWEQIDLYVYLLKNKKPLLVSFGYTGPLYYKNQIVSIHDVAFKYYKETFSKTFSLVYNFIVPRLAKKCVHIFSVSESAKNEVCKELGVEGDKITVVYNGISSFFKKIDKGKTIKKHAKPYILTVSSHHPRKNFNRLIEAFKRIDNDKIDLYIIGNFVSHFSDSTNDQSNENIKFLTNITDNELLGYYQNAELFVFPSLYEGFGIPVIEAMSQNLPCVLSDIPVFKEIGDKSVIYVNPQNVNSIKQGIIEGLKLNVKKIEYTKLNHFTWDKSAQRVIQVFKKNKT